MPFYKDSRNNTHFLDSAEFLHYLPTGCVEISEAEYLILQAPAAAKLWADYQSKALSALDKSDVTMIRCIEKGVAVPAAWGIYRGALRAIISAASGDALVVLPARPAYPAGT